MAELRDILQRDEFVNLSNEEAMEYGNQRIVVRQDRMKYDWGTLTEALLKIGVEKELVAKLIQLVESYPSGVILGKFLDVRGVVLSSEFMRETIEGLKSEGAGDLVSVFQKLLEIGIVEGTRWELFDVTQPSMEDIASARQSNEAYDWWSQVRDELVPPALSAGDSKAAIKTLIAGS